MSLIATSFTADMNRASMASFPGHLMILPSGNFWKKNHSYAKDSEGHPEIHASTNQE